MPEVLTLLDKSDETVDDGVWFEVGDYLNKTIHVINLTGSGVLQIYGACVPTKPSDATDHMQVGSDITAGESATPVNDRYKWLKTKKSTGGAGTGQTKAYACVHRESPQ